MSLLWRVVGEIGVLLTPGGHNYLQMLQSLGSYLKLFTLSIPAPCIASINYFSYFVDIDDVSADIQF